MIFFKKIIQGVGLATLSFNRYNMAQGLLGRSCFKNLNIMKKLPLPLPPPLKNSKNLFFLFVAIFFKRKLSYLNLRSGKFGSLVTSFSIVFHILYPESTIFQ